MIKKLSKLILFCSVIVFAFACSKNNSHVNTPPAANAGNNQTIKLPVDSVMLVGAGVDADGKVVGYLWSEVSGPSSAKIVTADSASTKIRSMASGTYVFQLAVTDNDGAKGFDTVSVIVLPANKPPLANAGIDQTIQLPVNYVHLIGSGSDNDGTVTAYSWNEISGPNNAVIANTDSSSTMMNSLVSGTYIFKLTVVDNEGAKGSDTVSVVVQPSPIYTISLQPSNNQSEIHLLGNSSGYNGSDYTAPEIGAAEWTSSGVPVSMRGAFAFDFSTIPSNATITSAKLTLYSNPTPLNGDGVDANYGSDNAMLIQQITSAWTASSTSWSNQPSTTTTNQILINSTNQSLLNLTDVDVSTLVQNMVSGNNYGFEIRLQNEVLLNSRIFCSSKYSDATKHPKIVVQYQLK